MSEEESSKKLKKFRVVFKNGSVHEVLAGGFTITGSFIQFNKPNGQPELDIYVHPVELLLIMPVE